MKLIREIEEEMSENTFTCASRNNSLSNRYFEKVIQSIFYTNWTIAEFVSRKWAVSELHRGLLMNVGRQSVGTEKCKMFHHVHAWKQMWFLIAWYVRLGNLCVTHPCVLKRKRTLYFLRVNSRVGLITGGSRILNTKPELCLQIW